MNKHSLPIRFCALALFGAWLGTQLAAQEILHSLDGVTDFDEFGFSVSSVGDIDGDGRDDVLVGAYGDDRFFVDAGSAQVFSGSDGSVLLSFHGEAFGAWMGFSVSGAGDVNGDGRPDVVVGAPRDTAPSGDMTGSASVFSGADGSLLYRYYGVSGGDQFGMSVSGAGDVDNDGFDDVIVGAWLEWSNGPLAGSARVFSGQTGALIHTFIGDTFDDRLGISVSGLGDLNADGHDDVVVGAYLDAKNGPGSGSAIVYDGATGAPLYLFAGDSPGDVMGWSVSDAGDVNGDGVPDVIAGAPSDDNNGPTSGLARVYSGADGSTLYSFEGDSAEDTFAWSVSGAGDVNNDGFADLIVGAREERNGLRSGTATVFSGVDGSILWQFEGDSAEDDFAYSVSGAGDVDQDGFADLVIGAPADDNVGSEAGTAWVYRGASPPPLLLTATTFTAGVDATLDVSGATPAAVLYFAYSLTGLGTTSVPPFGVDLGLAAAQPLVAVTVDAAGKATWLQPISSGLTGLVVWLQALESGAVSNWLRREIQ